MPNSILWKCALLFTALLMPAAHAASDQIDALELSQNWQGLVGRTVTITGCMITSATPDLMMCLATSTQGRPPAFPVDPSGMAPDDLARALRDCSFYVGYPICGVLLEGEVASERGELQILHGSVTWTYPPRSP
jgi:hypothetical protein